MSFSDRVLDLKGKTDACQIFEVFLEQKIYLVKQTMKSQNSQFLILLFYLE